MPVSRRKKRSRRQTRKRSQRKRTKTRRRRTKRSVAKSLRKRKSLKRKTRKRKTRKRKSRKRTRKPRKTRKHTRKTKTIKLSKKKYGGKNGALCIGCKIYESNRFGDYCCRTCAGAGVNNSGNHHGQSILPGSDHPEVHKSVNKDKRNCCKTCGVFEKAGGGKYDKCCRSCNGTNHGQSMTNGSHPKACRGGSTVQPLPQYPPSQSLPQYPPSQSQGNVVKFYERKDPYYEFTNFYRQPVRDTVFGTNLTFPTSEHFFQAMKYWVVGRQDMNKVQAISSLSTPRQAFDFVRDRNNNPYDYTAFDKVKNSVMLSILVLKFNQNPNLKQLLQRTGNKRLIENSPNDPYWGVGIKINGQNQTGPETNNNNWLGKLLMEVRALTL